MYLQRSLADGVRLVPLGDDPVEVLRERLSQRDVGARQGDAAGPLVELLDPLHVDPTEGALAEQLQLRVLDASDRVDDVVDVERLAVVELDAVADADEVPIGLLVPEFLGQAELDAALLVEVHEALEARHQAHDVRLRDDVLAVDEVGRAARRGLTERAPSLDLRSCERRLGERAERSPSDHDPQDTCSAEQVFTRHSALNLAAECFVGGPHSRPPRAVARDLAEVIPAGNSTPMASETQVALHT